MLQIMSCASLRRGTAISFIISLVVWARSARTVHVEKPDARMVSGVGYMR